MHEAVMVEGAEDNGPPEGDGPEKRGGRRTPDPSFEMRRTCDGRAKGTGGEELLAGGAYTVKAGPPEVSIACAVSRGMAAASSPVSARGWSTV